MKPDVALATNMESLFDETLVLCLLHTHCYSFMSFD